MASFESLPNDQADAFLYAGQDAVLPEVEEVAEIEVAAGAEEEIEPASFEHSDDAIKVYLREIQRNKLLNAAEEKEVAARIDLGDKAARDQMIVCNLRLVVSIAKRYKNRGLAFLDLIEEGNLGLIKAAEGFKLSKECRFSTYATWWIRQTIERALMNQSRTIRLPVHISEQISRMHKVTRQFRSLMNREPTLTEIAEGLETDLGNVQKLTELLKKTWSIDQPLGADGDFSLIDILEDKTNLSPATRMEEVNMFEQVSGFMDKFTDTEKMILTLRFGLDDEEPQTLDTIGRSVGVTRERIRQIESQLLVRLRKLIKSTPASATAGKLAPVIA